MRMIEKQYGSVRWCGRGSDRLGSTSSGSDIQYEENQRTINVFPPINLQYSIKPYHYYCYFIVIISFYYFHVVILHFRDVTSLAS